MRLTFLAVSAFIVFAGLVSPGLARAQDSEGLQLQPAMIEEKVLPGSSYQYSIKITNVSDVEKTLYLDAMDIEGIDAGGTPRFAPPGAVPLYALSSWVELSDAPLTLGAGQSASVTFTVRVPAEASPGSHFGGIFFDAKAPERDTTGAGVGMKVGTILTLLIAGDVLEDARLREFSTDRVIYGTADVAFTSRVENMGNIHLRPHGFIELTDMFGRLVASVPINEVGAAVFPMSDRTFSSVWTGEGFFFGRYQAVASVSYGDETRKTLTAAASFWVLPLQPLLTGLAVFIGVVLGLYFWVRMYIRRQLTQMGVPRKGASLDYYAQRQGSGGNLLVIVLSLVVLCVVLLALLFVLFA